MRLTILALSSIVALAGCYDPTIRDGQFTCSAADPSCPSGLSCDPCAHTCVRTPAASCDGGTGAGGDMAHASGGGDMAQPPMPTCSSSSDCTGSSCPPGSTKGCICVLPPNMTTMVCASACSVDADCPPGPNMSVQHCQPTGNCGP